MSLSEHVICKQLHFAVELWGLKSPLQKALHIGLTIGVGSYGVNTL